MMTRTVESESPLLTWLLVALQPMARSSIKQLLRDGRIVVNGDIVSQFDHPLQSGDTVTVARDSVSVPKVSIVYQDDDIIVIDKASGLLSVSTEVEKARTAFVLLSEHLTKSRQGRPFVVHRLDRETSGLLLFARSIEIRDELQKEWPRITKTYLAVVEGVPRMEEGVVENFLIEGRDFKVRSVVEDPLAKWAVTRYRTIRHNDRYSLVEVGLETGRKHQIRVHLAGLGCPVVGDTMYAAKTDPVKRLALHAWKLSFEHPTTKERVRLESPLPNLLRKLVNRQEQAGE